MSRDPDEPTVSFPDASEVLPPAAELRKLGPCEECRRNRAQLATTVRRVTGLQALVDQIDSDRRDIRVRVLTLELLACAAVAWWIVTSRPGAPRE